MALPQPIQPAPRKQPDSILEAERREFWRATFIWHESRLIAERTTFADAALAEFDKRFGNAPSS